MKGVCINYFLEVIIISVHVPFLRFFDFEII